MSTQMKRLVGWIRRRLPRSPDAVAPVPPQLVEAPRSDPAPFDHRQIEQIVALLNDRSQPNINALSEITRNLDILALNVKNMGYTLARRLATRLPVATDTKARTIGITSKLSTQRDIESDWVAHWSAQLGIPLFYHRKFWEFAYVLQAIHEGGHMREGARGLGFGCGTEPITSYLAAQGIAVTMTDLAPQDDRVKSWVANNEYAATIEHAHHPALVARDRFLELVTYRNVDMNAVPDDLVDYDFCWSICALEHLGSIEQGLAFIERSLATLRPGGVAVHTTEFNVNPLGPTIDNWVTVLFQRKHFEALAARLEAAGHSVAPFDFDPGQQPLDRFIDLPPWGEGTMEQLVGMVGQPAHLKLAIDGFVSTCIGIVVTKGG